MYYFASDMHLGASAGGDFHARERMLVEWLEKVSRDAAAIFLLGDLFDFWFEYRNVVPKGFTRLLGKLSELTDRGVEIHLFVGNHDLWSSGYLETECGLTVHHDTALFDLYGKRIFIAHGDNLGEGRSFGERFLNVFFRSKPAKWLFERIVHPDLALALGHRWSRGSRKSHGEGYKFWGEREPLVRFARNFVSRTPVDYFVFGHLHHFLRYPLGGGGGDGDGDGGGGGGGGGAEIIFLGDWIHTPSYAALSPDGSISLTAY